MLVFCQECLFDVTAACRCHYYCSTSVLVEALKRVAATFGTAGPPFLPSKAAQHGRWICRGEDDLRGRGCQTAKRGGKMSRWLTRFDGSQNKPTIVQHAVLVHLLFEQPTLSELSLAQDVRVLHLGGSRSIIPKEEHIDPKF
jgi:hypothetical protein